VRVIKRANARKWAYGLVGVLFFLLYSLMEFVLEFAKDTRVYWGSISANQWMLIGLFAESLGVLYVRGGGREHLRPAMRALQQGVSKIGNIIYAKLSRRNTSHNQKTS
jgi:prolipoprotein diacylglyceryltransferase